MPLNFRVLFLHAIMCSESVEREKKSGTHETSSSLLALSWRCLGASSKRLKSVCSFFNVAGEQAGKRDAGSRRERGKSLSKNQGTVSAPRRSQFPGHGGNIASTESRLPIYLPACLLACLPACLPALNSHASIRMSQRAYPRTMAP